MKAVYGRGKDLAQKHSTDFSRLSSFTIDDSRIYNVECVFDYGVVLAVTLNNSTLYNLSQIAFFSSKSNDTNDIKQCEPIKVTNCTLVDLKKNLVQTAGGYGYLTNYENNISILAGDAHIAYGVKGANNSAYTFVIQNNIAATGSGIKIADFTNNGAIDNTKSRAEIFPNEDAGDSGKNFTPADGITIGDPRWKK